MRVNIAVYTDIRVPEREKKPPAGIGQFAHEGHDCASIILASTIALIVH